MATKEYKTPESAFTSIREHGSKLKGMPRGLGAKNTYAKSGYADEVKTSKTSLSAALASLPTLTPADKADLETKMTKLDQSIEKMYNGWVQGERYDPAAWNALFTDVQTKLRDIKAAAPAGAAGDEQKRIIEAQEEELKSIQNEKQFKEAKKLASDLDAQHNTNHSINLSYQIAKDVYKIEKNDLFEEILHFDEKQLDEEMKGQYGGAMRLASLGLSDEEYMKKIKELRDSKRRLFTSERYKDADGRKIVYEKTKDGGFWPRPPIARTTDKFEAAYPKYLKAYMGAFELARITNPTQAFTFSVFRSQEGHHGEPHPIQTADDIKLRVLSVFEAAKNKNAILILDDETRNHLKYLQGQGGRDAMDVAMGRNPVSDAVEAVFAIEREMLKGSKQNELIGKNATKWENEVKASEAKVAVPGAGTTNSMEARLAAEMATPAVARLATPEERGTEAIKQMRDKYYAFPDPGNVPGDSTDQIQEMKTQVDALDQRIADAMATAALIESQISALTHAATAKPDAEQVHRDTGHIVQLEALRDKNESNIEDLKIRAELYKATIGSIITSRGTPEADARVKLLDRTNAQIKSIDDVVAKRNNDPANIPQKVADYKKHQQKEAKQQKDQYTKMMKIVR